MVALIGCVTLYSGKDPQRLQTMVSWIGNAFLFTAGIAVIIFASQIKELLGLTLAGKEPGPFIPKLQALGQALPTVNLAAVAVTVLSIAVIAVVRRFRPHWPAFLIAVGLAALLSGLLDLPVATIGSQFGGIPRSLPMPHLPPLSLEMATNSMGLRTTRS